MCVRDRPLYANKDVLMQGFTVECILIRGGTASSDTDNKRTLMSLRRIDMILLNDTGTEPLKHCKTTEGSAIGGHRAIVSFARLPCRCLDVAASRLILR